MIKAVLFLLPAALAFEAVDYTATCTAVEYFDTSRRCSAARRACPATQLPRPPITPTAALVVCEGTRPDGRHTPPISWGVRLDRPRTHDSLPRIKNPGLAQTTLATPFGAR